MTVTTLRSSTLTFSRDGRFLIAVDPTDVVIVDARDQKVRRLGLANVTSAIGFADQLWTVRDTVFERWSLDGAPIGVAKPLAGHDGVLVPAAVGPHAALWSAQPPCALIEDGASVLVGPAPATGLAIPLTGRRWIVASGARVTAPSGLSCELPTGSRVVAGTVVLDGSAVAVIAERPAARDLAIIGLANGRLLLHRPLSGAQIRIAARAGIAVVQAEPRRLVILELRSGRVLGEHATAFDLADLAIDPDGTNLALRGGPSHVELLAMRDALVARPADLQPSDPEVRKDEAPQGSRAHASHVESLPVPGASSWCVIDGSAVVAAGGARGEELLAQAPASEMVIDARAFGPRSAIPVVDQPTALELLGHELRLVALRTLRAIAHAWDTRRLGYGNEGRHPYEHEVAALLGMNAGFARDYLAAANDHLTDHQREHDVSARRYPATPVGALATELGLSPIAVEILLIVAAPALWSEAARLYGILANDAGRPTVDEALVEQLLGLEVSRHVLVAELDPRAPLVRLGIIDVDPRRPRPFAALTVDAAILARLRREEPDLGVGLVARGSDRAHQELALGPDVLPGAFAALADVKVPARIALRGRPGSGRRTLLAALAADANRALGILDVTLLPRSERELVVGVERALRRGQLAGLFPCVVGIEAIAFDDRTGREVLFETIRSHPGPLAVILPPGETAPFDPGHISIDLPVLAESARLAVWTQALADAGVTVADAAAIAARYRVGPGVIHRAVKSVRTRPADATAEIDRYIRQARDVRLSAYARRVERLAEWSQIVLPPDITDSLRELVSRVRFGRTVYETWGMAQTMATSRGLTALFSGPPGTGKTLVAGVIARELGLDLYQVDLSKVMSKWIGETERNLGSIFDAAEDGQVILLFDEADSLFAKRTEVRSSNDRYANLEVNYLLQRLDSFEGIAIMTTNASGSIDPAFKRRLSFRLSFPFPDEETREELWRAHLPATLPVTGPLALDRLSHKYQLSGGYIRNACLRAAFLAAQDGGSLTQHHLERAVALEFAELGKLSNSGALD